MPVQKSIPDLRNIRKKSAPNPPENTTLVSRSLRNLAVLFTSGSILIHLASIPARVEEYLPYGLFLGAIVLLQFGLMIALILRPSRRLAFIGSLLCLAMITAIVVFQATALPIGPHPWNPAGFNDADLTGVGTIVFTAITLLITAWRPATQNHARRRFNFAYIPAVLVTLALTFFGVASALNPAPIGMNMSAPVPAGQAAVPITSLGEPPGNQPVKSFTLVAQRKNVEGHELWTYNGMTPGPELRVTQGDRLRITLVNHLPTATSIHWHGISLPNLEDGVAGVTQDAVPPGGSYTYKFVVKDAGTYLYHSHQDSFHQILNGLFGALIVEPKTGLVADRDYAVVIHEAPKDTTNLRDILGQWIVGAPANQAPAVNGATGNLRLAAKPGERVRLRLIGVVQADMKVSNIPDMMHASPQELVLIGAGYQVAAIDGRDLNGPQEIGPARIRLGIGQRYDLSFKMPANSAVRLVDVGGNETVTIGDGPLPQVPDLLRLPVFDFTSYGAPAPDPILALGRFDVTYPVILEKHFGFREGKLELVHTMNGLDSPMGAQFVVSQGQVVRLHIDNKTDEIHTMHLHGHHFSILAHNGLPLRGSPVQLDSLLVDPHESWDIAFVADNPGLWMFHCHVLLHAEFGMSAMVVYQGVTTPYDIGSRSGNKPE